MYKQLTILILLLTGITLTSATPTSDLSLSQLEQRLAEIDDELGKLAHYDLNGGVGAIGYQSLPLKPDQKVSVHIDWDEERLIDQVVLVPTLWRDTEKGPRADGFPQRFRVLAGTANTTNMVASYTEENHLLPRIAPLSMSFLPIKASWISIKVDTPPLIEGDSRRFLKLAEIMVFSGPENVALRKPVSVTSSMRGHIALHEQYMVDGFVPYLMDAAQGDESQAIQLQIDPQASRPHLTIDLGVSHLINQVNLHAIDQSRTIPASYLNDFAIPRHLRVTGANQRDFSDETVLYEYEQKSVGNIGPIIMNRFQETSCRYVRITVLQPKSIFALKNRLLLIGFGEIEVLSKGKNIALGCPVIVSSGIQNRRKGLERMTDGRNFFGNILPIREWMNQLAQRHELETERPIVSAELTRRYTHQKSMLKRMIRLATLLAAGIVISILIERLVHHRQMAGMRNRFAADLHDELGANLHVIGLLGDLAQAAVNSPEKLKKLHQRIRVMTERSGIAVREFTSILESETLYGDLLQNMQRATERITESLEGNLSFQGEENLPLLKQRMRIDLFLFYKECLINISRHSGATKFSAHLTASSREICLIVSDNGKGMANTKGEIEIPPSLRRRAHLLNAKVSAENPKEGGTRVVMKLRLRRGLHHPILQHKSPQRKSYE
jgi:signal transduction histidine kinase